MNLFNKTEIDSQTQETNLGLLPNEKEGAEQIRNLGLMHTTYIKQINSNDLLCSTENHIHYLVTTYNRKESEKVYMYTHICICITESLCCTPEANTAV